METIGTYTPDNFHAGTYPITRETAIVKASTQIARHAPVKLEGGKLLPVTAKTATAANADNVVPAKTALENTVAGLYGIAAEGGSGGDEIAVYLTGEFLADALVYESGVLAATLKDEFRKLGIFLKEAQD
jgi:hypothetical protein